MKVFIVFAHPERRSFNGAMLDAAVSTLTGAGHEVRVSDLYQMNFAAAVGRDDFTDPPPPGDPLNLQAAQNRAQANGTIARDIAAEQEKLLWCDALVMQFPFYWFSVPAILKGWVDRVMAVGFSYGPDKRYGTGGLVGRRAMVSMTTGGPASSFAPDGIAGDMDLLLWPIQSGILRFNGFTVLPPLVAYQAARVDDATRREYLETMRQRMLTLGSAEPLFFHPLSDFGPDRRLKPGVVGRTPMHRRP